MFYKNRFFGLKPGPQIFSSFSNSCASLKLATWNSFEKSVRVGAGLLVAALLSNFLGPTRFGELSFAISFIALFSALSTFGLDSILIRSFSSTQFRAGEVLCAAILTRLAGSLLSFGIIVISSFFFEHSEGVSWMILVISSGMFFGSFRAIEKFFLARQDARAVALVALLSSIISISLNALFVYLEKTVLWFAFVILIDQIVLSIVLLVLTQIRGIAISEWKVQKTALKELIAQAIPMIFLGSALIIQARIDQVLLHELFGGEAVGQFSVALRLAEGAAILTVVMSETFMPRATKAREVGGPHFEAYMMRLHIIFISVGVITALPLALIGETLILRIFGASFQAGAELMPWFALRLFLSFLGTSRSLYFIAEAKTWYLSKTMFISLPVNLVLNLIFIPMAAEQGAAIAMVISFFFSSFLVDLFFKEGRRHLNILFAFRRST